MTIPAPNIAFDELITFLASSPSASEIVAYRPPEQLQARMRELMEKNRQGSLSIEEQSELDEFLRMNHFTSHLQAKAKQNLSRSCPLISIRSFRTNFQSKFVRCKNLSKRVLFLG